ncbi:hypothetical protein H4R20_001964 [Coemansia guatemalensis]|uniref:Uncharacterized protein n=1 Tax=Coemansia guatemalensis TaxID=2761395 RepID=A0A9W8LVH0_9FUNG|nr:hypothetical protein H4R20_001964 [Coemansia guatemalensis]
MRDSEDTADGPLPIVADRSLFIFTLIIFIISSFVSLVAFLYGLVVVYFQRHVWQSPIIRVVIVAQIINSIRFVLRIVGTFVNIGADFGCRMVLFLNYVFSTLPVNLCIYCVVYLQLVVLHKLSPDKRWPRVVALTIAVVLSIVPTTMILVLPARLAGTNTFCHLHRITNHQQYVFTICTVAIWEYLPGVFGIISVSILGIHIIRTQRETQRALQASLEYYGALQLGSREGNPDMLHRTMINIIWFPITPIISLWLNMILISVAYYKQRTYLWLEYINTVLLGLQSVLIGVALVVNPTIREAVVAEWAERRRQKQLEKAAAQRSETERERRGTELRW